MKWNVRNSVSGLSAALLVVTALAPTRAHAGEPTAIKGYEVSTFAKGNETYSKPDSIAYANGDIFIGYGGNGLPDGSDGKSSYILEYTQSGTLVHTYTVLGHNDGLKLDPYTGLVFSMQNEDAHPNLVGINPVTHTQSAAYQFAPPPHGGGYDDMVFLNHHLYLSCSNPAKNPNTRPAIVEASYTDGLLRATNVLEGNAWATDVVTGAKVTLNLQDPDSMTTDPEGDLFLDSQGDSEVMIVRNPGTKTQNVLQIPLSSPYGTPQLDDTTFTPSGNGFLLVADTPNNTVYAIRKTVFAPGVAYSAACVPSASGCKEGFVGKLDLDSGNVTPVVNGLGNPHGLFFIPTK